VMRLWLRFRRKADSQRAARQQGTKARSGKPHPRRNRGPLPDDPIKNWESADQTFLRQAGDPFLDG
jgi:hypothetical protein